MQNHVAKFECNIVRHVIATSSKWQMHHNGSHGDDCNDEQEEEAEEEEIDMFACILYRAQKT